MTAVSFLKQYWTQLALLAVCAILLGMWGAERVDHAQTESAFATFRAQVAGSNQKAERDARAEEQRRAAAQREIDEQAKNELAASRVELAAARDAGSKLRAALDTWRKRAAAASAAVATISPSVPSGDPIGMLTDMLDRADIRAEEVHRYADELRISGLACERAYESLTPK